MKTIKILFYFILYFLSQGVATASQNQMPSADNDVMKITFLGTGAPRPSTERYGPSIYVEAGNHKILVDAGPGMRERLFEAGGFDAISGVDHILITHLHFDHVGWNLRAVNGQYVPTFPNARYLFARTEVEHTRTDDHMEVLAHSIDPLITAGLVDLVETDHQLTEDVRLIPTPGHTPGHVSVLIESNAASALITGDMTHTPLQFAVPELAASAFDTDSALSTQTRRDIIERFVDTDTLVLGTHFAPPTGGHLRRSLTGARFDT